MNPAGCLQLTQYFPGSVLSILAVTSQRISHKPLWNDMFSLPPHLLIYSPAVLKSNQGLFLPPPLLRKIESFSLLCSSTQNAPMTESQLMDLHMWKVFWAHLTAVFCNQSPVPKRHKLSPYSKESSYEGNYLMKLPDNRIRSLVSIVYSDWQ